MEWLGFRGNEATEGTTIYDGVRAACAGAVLLADGEAPPPAAAAPVALVVVGEAPYAEAAGDTHDLTLDAADAALIDALHDPAGARKLVCVLLCGRPLVLPPPLLAKLDALVVAWLPGTEGAGVADLLFGETPFEGRLSFSWPRDNAQARREAREKDPLYRRGFGL